jgi:tRNA-dihydrouridine synthase C
MKAAIPQIQLAPMEGVLDWVLRELLSEVGGLDRMVTEFVRVTDMLLPAHVFHRYCPELENGGFTRAGTPVFIQLLGGQAGPLAENAAFAVELGAPGIDLNFGCPAKTVNRHDGGATLLKHPERVFEVTKAVRAAVDASKPVTAKVRLGFDNKDLHREIAQAAEEGGADHIVVHARTKAEMYQPPAHWHYIKTMSEGRTIPFLANGEIWSVEDYRACVAACGVERVALGRGLVRRPTLAHEIRGSKSEFDAPEFLNRFFERSFTFRGEAYAVARMKQMLRYWSSGDALHAQWFQRVKTAARAEQIREFLSDIGKDIACLKFKSTLGPTAPSAFAPKSFSKDAV